MATFQFFAGSSLYLFFCLNCHANAAYCLWVSGSIFAKFWLETIQWQYWWSKLPWTLLEMVVAGSHASKHGRRKKKKKSLGTSWGPIWTVKGWYFQLLRHVFVGSMFKYWPMTFRLLQPFGQWSETGCSFSIFRLITATLSPRRKIPTRINLCTHNSHWIYSW